MSLRGGRGSSCQGLSSMLGAAAPGAFVICRTVEVLWSPEHLINLNLFLIIHTWKQKHNFDLNPQVSLG